MAVVPHNSLNAYCERVPEVNRWKLNKQLDFEHDGVQTHLGVIADSMDEWEGPVAEALGLKTVDVSAIKTKYPDNLTLQAREALHHWQEKNGLDSTYHNLIAVFLKAGKTSYAEAVCKVLGMDSKHEPENTSSVSVPNEDAMVRLSIIDEVTANSSSTESQGIMPLKSYVDEKKRLLKENLAKIKKSFATLKVQVQSILKKKDIDMEEFIGFVSELVPPGCVQEDAVSIFKIFQAISKNLLWSYSDYSILKSVAEAFAEDDTEPLIESYETELASFYATTKLANYIDLCQDEDVVADPDEPLVPNPAKYNKEYFQKLTIKIGRRVTGETLQYIIDLWKAVSKFFALPPLQALLDRVLAGSLTISWFIPCLSAMQIRLNSTGSEAEAFYHTLQIIEVKIDDESLYHFETTAATAVDHTKLALLEACKKRNVNEFEVLDLLGSISDFDFSQYEETPLTTAVRFAPINIIKVLLLYTALDVNARNKGGWTALILACMGGKTDVVELLLNHNADVNATDREHGATALMMTSQEGRIEVVELLLKHNANVNAKAENGKTALAAASVFGRTDVVELLIKYNADINARTEKGLTALMAASFSGQIDVMKLLVEHHADVNARDEIGVTALIRTSMYGRADVVESLLELGADVDAKIESDDGGTALMVATQEGRTDVMEILIKHNADVNARRKSGRTALMMASFYERSDVMELLLKHKADVTARDEEGGTALMMASQEGRADIVELLLKYNADVDARNKNGVTALMAASLKGRTDVIRVLIRYKADVNARQENGFTALAVATQNNKNIESVKTLLEAGADPNIAENETNWTPLFFASKDGREDIVMLLVEHGADVDYKDKNGITALDTARTYNHTEIIDLLMAFSMSMETTDVLSEEVSEATPSPPPQLSEETIKHVLSAGKHNQTLFKKLKMLFKKFPDILLPEIAKKREATSRPAMESSALELRA